MALFDYTGQLQSGRAFQGTLEADSRQHAEATLTDMGVRVTSLRVAQRTGYIAPLSLDELLLFNEQLAGLTKAQLPLEDGLRQLAADAASRKLKRLLLELADELHGGATLEQALARQTPRFPTEYAGVVKAGLQAGDLGGVLHGLSTHLRLRSTARRALYEIAVYPVVVLIFATIVLSFVMRSIVPKLASIMHEMGEFPRAFGWGSSAWDVSYLIFSLAEIWRFVEMGVAAALGLGLLLYLMTLLPGGRRLREWLLRRLPGMGQVYWSSVLARFTHTAALGAFSGIPLPELLRSSGDSSGSGSLAGTARRISHKLEQGESLPEAAKGERNLPALWSYVVAAASRRGDLPATLQELARTYEVRAQRWADGVRVVLGPLLFVIVGAVIATTVLGIVLAFGGLIRAMSNF